MHPLFFNVLWLKIKFGSLVNWEKLTNENWYHNKLFICVLMREQLPVKNVNQIGSMLSKA